MIGLEVLEIGCGTGLLSLQIAPYVRSLVAVDASEGMIDALENKLKTGHSSIKNVLPVCTMLEDPENAALPTASCETHGERRKFDLILSHLVLHHIPDLQGLLRTMMGCLKPGGSIALTDYEDFGPEARKFHPGAKIEGVERHGIKRDWFASLMRDAGFDDVKCESGWIMRKQVERVEGEWGSSGERPTVHNNPSVIPLPLAEMDFPFLLCRGRKL
jgi:SAM-dependent methyltransferase